MNVKLFNGKIALRFPPQPSGFLHIGHLKSIRINFQTAKRLNGICYLRYDDTNPITSSLQFQNKIIQNIKWLGYQPFKITRASQYQYLFKQYAQKLIVEGKAYMDFSSKQQLAKQRKNKQPSIYRDTSISQNKQLFNQFIQVKGKGKNCIIRLKLDYKNSNSTLRDPGIYRIVNNQARALYDFAHPICDSIQGISHSFCSLQFEIRRDLYYTILDLLNLYKPIVWQYSRLNIQGSPISKRNIRKLIQNNIIHGWDDPRLLTLQSLRNQGYTPDVLFSFIDKLGFGRHGNQKIIKKNLLQKQLMSNWFNIMPRTMSILNPIQTIIQNYQQQNLYQMLYPFKQQSIQKYEIKGSNKIFLQKDDILGNKQKGRDQVKINDIIILKYWGLFIIKQINQKYCKIQKISQDKIKQNVNKKILKKLHWIGEQDISKQKVYLYSRLLQREQQINIQKIKQKNTQIIKQIYINKNINKLQFKFYQFQRIGYFTKYKDGWLKVIDN